MQASQRPFVEKLKDQLGAGGILRLSDLMYRDCLTPTEARSSLEPPHLPWDEIEATLFQIFVRRDPDDPLPWHLARWLDRYRAVNTSSLFDD